MSVAEGQFEPGLPPGLLVRWLSDDAGERQRARDYWAWTDGDDFAPGHWSNRVAELGARWGVPTAAVAGALSPVGEFFVEVACRRCRTKVLEPVRNRSQLDQRLNVQLCSPCEAADRASRPNIERPQRQETDGDWEPPPAAKVEPWPAPSAPVESYAADLEAHLVDRAADGWQLTATIPAGPQVLLVFTNRAYDDPWGEP